LCGGRWGDHRILSSNWIQTAINSPIPANTPRSTGEPAAMIAGQRTMGGKFNITPVGPGYYSFNWWLNRTNLLGQHLFPDASSDVYVASGHGGMRVLYLVPHDGLVVCWNDAVIEDHDRSPGDPSTRMNQAARLIRDCDVDSTNASMNLSIRSNTAVALGIRGTSFTIDGRPTFLLGLSYYGGLAATPEMVRADLDDAVGAGFNWLRVWANWQAFGRQASAIDENGRADAEGLTRLKSLLNVSRERGVVLDLTLTRGRPGSGPGVLATFQAHSNAVELLVRELQPWRNWYFDLANERNISDARHVSFEELASLRALVRKLDPDRLVTASHGGDLDEKDVSRYLRDAQIDFLTPHRPRSAGTASETEMVTRQLFGWSGRVGHLIPIHFQEPFRRGYTDWQPRAADFQADLEAARRGGAAGWCFHNGDQRKVKDSMPRRSFDLHARRLFEQLDAEEMTFIQWLREHRGGRE